jgi:hypothetical protein
VSCIIESSSRPAYAQDKAFCVLLPAQHFLDEGEWPLTPDKALLASIATSHLLLWHAAIGEHELQ